MTLETAEGPGGRPFANKGRPKKIKLIGKMDKHFIPVDQYTHPDGKNYSAGSGPEPINVHFTRIKVGTYTGELPKKPGKRFIKR